MNLAYRLDMALDLFDINVDGQALLLNEAELHVVKAAIAELDACWSEPKSAQVWAAICQALGRDPRA